MTREPDGMAGAQETELTPVECASAMTVVSQTLSPLCFRMRIEPSDEAVANHKPTSCGAQQIEFTDAKTVEISIKRNPST